MQNIIWRLSFSYCRNNIKALVLEVGCPHVKPNTVSSWSMILNGHNYYFESRGLFIAVAYRWGLQVRYCLNLNCCWFYNIHLSVGDKRFAANDIFLGEYNTNKWTLQTYIIILFNIFEEPYIKAGLRTSPVQSHWQQTKIHLGLATINITIVFWGMFWLLLCFIVVI